VRSAVRALERIDISVCSVGDTLSTEHVAKRNVALVDKHLKFSQSLDSIGLRVVLSKLATTGLGSNVELTAFLDDPRDTLLRCEIF
jgi:hypothetical protein